MIENPRIETRSPIKVVVKTDKDRPKRKIMEYIPVTNDRKDVKNADKNNMA